MAESEENDRVSCSAGDDKRVFAAPALAYLPPVPKHYRPKIGVIGCGAIVPYHLRAYRKQGYDVVALCDVNGNRACELQHAHFPSAQVYADFHEVLKRDDIEVVDIATHPEIRLPMIEAALRAGKHVLSQKPFVTDLDEGERLCDLADAQGVKLAVNQNGRWAPHFSYMRAAIAGGHIGQAMAAHLAVHWDHNWTAETVFDKIRHLILFDFAIHWYDIVGCFLSGVEATRVFASTSHAPGQSATPPLLAQVLIEYPNAQASLTFDASTRVGARDTAIVIGTEGSIESSGPDINTHETLLRTTFGTAKPELQGDWFTNGFEGTMGELLCAIEEDWVPYNNARDNLRGLALCFAAVASADRHEPVVPGTVRRLNT